MGFGGSVQAMIDSIKFNARPKREVFSRDSLEYRNGENANPNDIEDSMEFRLNRMATAYKRSYLIWLFIILTTLVFVILFPCL